MIARPGLGMHYVLSKCCKSTYTATSTMRRHSTMTESSFALRLAKIGFNPSNFRTLSQPLPLRLSTGQRTPAALVAVVRSFQKADHGKLALNGHESGPAVRWLGRSSNVPGRTRCLLRGGPCIRSCIWPLCLAAERTYSGWEMRSRLL